MTLDEVEAVWRFASALWPDSKISGSASVAVAWANQLQDFEHGDVHEAFAALSTVTPKFPTLAQVYTATTNIVRDRRLREQPLRIVEGASKRLASYVAAMRDMGIQREVLEHEAAGFRCEVRGWKPTTENLTATRIDGERWPSVPAFLGAMGYELPLGQ